MLGVPAATSAVLHVANDTIPTAVEYDPAGHMLQPVAPVDGCQLPAAHGLHSVVPEAVEYVPGAHETQTAADGAPSAVEYSPLPQSVLQAPPRPTPVK